MEEIDGCYSPENQLKMATYKGSSNNLDKESVEHDDHFSHM